ncbi:ATP-binding protein [Nocardia sp. NPDC050413]|uniref:AlbA family DNA-binding domain-containing protein n=1 Tax=Nocardia sp. NPDC050413 TaxID=3155784 RepID=UPI0033F72A7B
MSFTALHRILGAAPGPLTDKLLDEAVAIGVAETDDLDWKSALPAAKGLPQTDFPKDIAAMANTGGGLIVYGVRESQKCAVERVDVGEFDEVYERSLRSAAMTAIAPPVFGLVVHRFGSVDQRAVAVEIPASVDGPHLIYRNEYFGAPIRNNSDTVWMKERQIEARYRARFDERRHAAEALDKLYVEAARGRDSEERAWLIAVGRPRVPKFKERLARAQARKLLGFAWDVAMHYTVNRGIHPIDSVNRHDLRPGLRRWVAPCDPFSRQGSGSEAGVAVHHEGTVTVAATVGGLKKEEGGGHNEGHQVDSAAIECGVADLMALIRVAAAMTGHDEYDLRIGIEWTGEQPLTIFADDFLGRMRDEYSQLHRYSPVDATVSALGGGDDFLWRINELARDCVNQGGINRLRVIRRPEPGELE